MFLKISFTDYVVGNVGNENKSISVGSSNLFLLTIRERTLGGINPCLFSMGNNTSRNNSEREESFPTKKVKTWREGEREKVGKLKGKTFFGFVLGQKGGGGG